MKDVTHVKMNEMKGELENIQFVLDSNILTVLNLLNSLPFVKKVPQNKMMNNIKVFYLIIFLSSAF